MHVETKIVGRRTPFERQAIELPDGPHTLRSLLEHLVRGEVAAYDERQGRAGLVRVLTGRELEAGAQGGRIVVAPQERAGRVSADEAVATALRAYGDGLYYVFLDDRQIEDLSAPLDLRPDSTLLLLRLTALAGG